MPGVQVQAHLDPTTLTKRLFTSARKMIASGRVTGWGDAARVARLVLTSKAVPYIGNDKWGIRVNGYIDLSEEAKAECRELYQAYILMCKVRETNTASRLYWDSKIARLESTFEHQEKYSYIQCDMAEFRDQISDIFLRNRYSVDRHKAQQVLTAFETGQPFPVNIFQ
jgi:hypothetical protein